MELDPSSVEGRWIQKKGEEEFTFHIDDALISAFCILGEDIAPAFEDSQVTQFELMREAIIGKKFKEEFEEMKNDFKDFLFTLGGKEQIDIDSNDNDLEGGTDSMLYKLNIENPSSVFSSLNVEEEASKIVISETEDTVVYFDLEDQKFYTRKFSLNEEEILEWAEDAEVIEFGLVPDTAVLEEAITTLKTTVTDFELEVEKKDTTIGELESSIVTLQGSVNTYEVLEKEIVLEAKKEIINEFREQVSEEDIESIESEIENFSAEEIKSKLALIVYELSKEEIDGDNPEPKFTHKPKGSDNGSTPAWFNEVVKNIKK
ncbi:MAG: hypothetical protein KQ78_01848 [Candidatus Izimaplasma bacterium HR2]|nr:MAG: hypothetical protein KQ78_01848 [Candidatus Izimaplasma bacterium HR2]